MARLRVAGRNGQVRRHVLGVGVDQVALVVADPVVVDHPGSSSFSSALQWCPQLAQTATARNQIPSDRVFQQGQLQFAQIIVRKQILGTADKDGELNKDHGWIVR